MVTSRWRGAVVAVLAIAASLAAPPAGPASARTSAESAGPAGVRVVDGRTQPVFSYSDAVREHLMVQAPVDSDGDGRRDRIAVDIIRPKETRQGLKVPVIMSASPYNDTVGRGFESERKLYDAQGAPVRFPLFYDNYFVPRGYAVVDVDMTGTGRSDGCPTVGGASDVAAAKAAIDWLGGRATAYAADGSEVKASWSTGKVGMIGHSYEGTLANAVAGTGVEGLETIVPISGISSWYEFARSGGAKHWNGFASWLTTALDSDPPQKCQAVRDRLQAGEDDATGNDNAHWHERDYIARPAPEVNKVRASVFAVHDTNDYNVRIDQFANWWAPLAERDVPRKLWLGRYGHTDPFDWPGRRALWVDTVHGWFDHWLYGLRNGIMDEPRVDLQTGPATWTTQADWPARTSPVSLRPGPDGSLALGPTGGTGTFTDTKLSEADLTADPSASRPGRLVFRTPPLRTGVRLSGTPIVDLRVTLDRPTSNLTALLVDYGEDERIDWNRNEPANGIHDGLRGLDEESCHGESTAQDDACYRKTANVTARKASEVIARGWLDAQNRHSVTTPEPLTPGRSYRITWKTTPDDYEIKPGHRLGLVLGGTDADFLYYEDPTGAKVTVDLGGSRVTVPVTAADGLRASR
ncbi:Xaa-Pro dipeptidyl-peptidase [Streptomyces sp. S465]|uniref:Xaa-Pro dipeptidyl-peptidase n=1 Tax=Streptomyces sp. S465 TaxID=2979468 RepID=UPI0022A80C5A|nr:Xaa-Pro dipeptidyl-peptidase [Streptomyces sp. S465]WAP54085.1 Xaa-Pro dipeptidyl-peptidase [Streptomyces sp. S465]